MFSILTFLSCGKLHAGFLHDWILPVAFESFVLIHKIQLLFFWFASLTHFKLFERPTNAAQIVHFQTTTTNLYTDDYVTVYRSGEHRVEPINRGKHDFRNLRVCWNCSNVVGYNENFYGLRLHKTMSVRVGNIYGFIVETLENILCVWKTWDISENRFSFIRMTSYFTI